MERQVEQKEPAVEEEAIMGHAEQVQAALLNERRRAARETQST